MVSSFFVLYTLAFLQKEGAKKYYVILAKVLRITLQSIIRCFSRLYLLTFSLAYLLYLSFFIAQKDTFLIFYL